MTTEPTDDLKELRDMNKNLRNQVEAIITGQIIQNILLMIGFGAILIIVSRL
jgi:membrane-bound ClpP family serine protease